MLLRYIIKSVCLVDSFLLQNTNRNIEKIVLCKPETVCYLVLTGKSFKFGIWIFINIFTSAQIINYLRCINYVLCQNDPLLAIE
jgi:hypothetical protein